MRSGRYGRNYDRSFGENNGARWKAEWIDNISISSKATGRMSDFRGNPGVVKKVEQAVAGY
jgi:hypothetical protein